MPLSLPSCTMIRQQVHPGDTAQGAWDWCTRGAAQIPFLLLLSQCHESHCPWQRQAATLIPPPSILHLPLPSSLPLPLCPSFFLPLFPHFLHTCPSFSLIHLPSFFPVPPPYPPHYCSPPSPPHAGKSLGTTLPLLLLLVTILSIPLFYPSSALLLKFPPCISSPLPSCLLWSQSLHLFPPVLNK